MGKGRGLPGWRMVGKRQIPDFKKWVHKVASFDQYK
jgi:hypothetical protein